jgi:HSP20 family protein
MLIPWRPSLDPFEEFEQMLGDSRGKAPVGFSPAVDVYEKGQDIIVEVPMAGIDPRHVDITIEDDVLSIKGQMEKKSEVEDKNYYRREVKKGSFYRQIAMPTRVLGDNASASFEDGVLKVLVPKAPEKKGKKIEVKIKNK